MGGIASAIIIPPSGSGLERVSPGSLGEAPLRRVAAVQAIPPLRSDGDKGRAGFHPDEGARGRGRDNREVRQLAIRPDQARSADPGAARGAGAGALAGGIATPESGGAPFTSVPFLAQMLGQTKTPADAPRAYHPDGAALGSEAYRRAGAAPPYYSEQPAVFRLAV